MSFKNLKHVADGIRLVGTVNTDELTAVRATLAGRSHPCAVAVDELVREKAVAV